LRDLKPKVSGAEPPSPIRNGKQSLPAKSPYFREITEQGVRNATAYRGEAKESIYGFQIALPF